MPLDKMVAKVLIFLTCVLAAAQGQFQFDSAIARSRKAEKIRSYMNLSVDPCDDFYEYACGNWGRFHPANLGVVETSPLSVLKAELNRELVQLFSQYSGNDTVTDKKLKDFFVSCLSVPQMVGPTYIAKLREIIHEFGKMPLLEGPLFDGDNFEWEHLIGRIRRQYGTEILLSLKYDKEKRLNIDHPSLSLDPEHYLGESDFYRFPYMTAIAEHLVNYLGVNHTLANRAAQEMVEFEKKLAAVNYDDEPEPRITTVNRMAASLVHLRIKLYLGEALPKTPNTNIVEVDYKYNRLLTAATQSTPKYVIANYIYYQLIKAFILEISPNPAEQSQKICVSETKHHFPDAVSNLIYRNNDIRHAEKGLTNLFYDLKAIFLNRINSGEYSWMSTYTREHARKKINGMKIAINTYKDVDFDEKYRHIYTKQFDYVENLKSIFMDSANKKIAKRGSVKKLHLKTMMYLMQNNTVYVSASLLKPEFFWSIGYPTSVNFGSLGVLLAHEMLHAFDTNFMNYNEMGEKSRWFDLKSRKHVHNGIDCLIGEFSTFKYYGKGLPLGVTQDENLADSGAVRLLHDVYEAWRTSIYRPNADQPNRADADMLPPLPFAGKQLFFISYAQSMCIDRIDAYRHVSAGEDYVPEPIRVRASLMNTVEFSRTFHCSKGANMNPPQRCEIY